MISACEAIKRLYFQLLKPTSNFSLLKLKCKQQPFTFAHLEHFPAFLCDFPSKHLLNTALKRMMNKTSRKNSVSIFLQFDQKETMKVNNTKKIYVDWYKNIFISDEESWEQQEFIETKLAMKIAIHFGVCR